MDAQGRGRADDIDPADQWVLNPHTGDYELRLGPSPEQSGVPSPRGTEGRAAGRRAARAEQAAGPPSRAAREGAGSRRRRAPQEEQPAPAGRRKQKPKKSRAKKVLLWSVGTLAFVLFAAAAAGYLYYQHLNDNITAIPDDGAGTGGFSKDRAINVLLIGTDKRTGKGNAGYGDSGSAGHADTTILLHVSKDRTNATALSIPRDMITDIPDCPTTQEDGSTKVIPGSSETRFNESLGQSGRSPSCAMRTATEITGLEIDHFMVADFNAVKSLSSAVGGVDICLAKDIDDPKSHLKLDKGKHTIAGEEALAFVRTRHSVGFGGDLSRIELQQQFLSSLMRKLKSNDTLTSPTKMFKLAEAGTKALTVDSKISDIGKLRDLGTEIGKVNTKNLSFATTPVVDNTDGATVLLKESAAEPLFEMMRADVSLTEVKKKEKEEKSKQDALLKGPKAKASEVRVDLYNGGAPAGSASQTLTWLQNQEGVLKSSQLGNADKPLDKTLLEYDPDQADQARRLAEIMGLPGSALKPGKSEENAQGLPAMKLTLGKDFKGAGVPLTPPKKAPDDVQRVEADKTVCAK
ncbi:MULTISPECIES: LCP family protein [Streptomyces]|uniref:Transcriptional regulator n=1 Tax=Streptomyces albus (strain ATCC 21838 / DSM 41398 / FERM P-419 / JCM 4703 / NBRC 107858) TaxID=1081613 RepID=A0A0B5EMZ9_STRA4|nr:LCP family protein [Streptomyces sp. SCSIO ZS0520]AJE82959.1 transcriptional regulator [Streptomyces albus]AOU77271.1 transcriptional regulator [Streptomyces albus]AYN33048.1 LytR family transcriptional regulator [Streptomyces albus]